MFFRMKNATKFFHTAYLELIHFLVAITNHHYHSIHSCCIRYPTIHLYKIEYNSSKINFRFSYYIQKTPYNSIVQGKALTLDVVNIEHIYV